MRRHQWISAIVWACTLLNLAPIARAAGPVGPPPSQARARFAQGQLWVEYTVWKPVWETKSRDEVVNGQTRTTTYSVSHQIPEQRLQPLAPGSYVARRVNGQAVAESEVARLLGEESRVLHVQQEQPLEASYAQLYDPQAIVIHQTPATCDVGGYGGGVAPMAAPQPADGPPAPVPPAPAPAPAAPQPPALSETTAAKSMPTRHATASLQNGKVALTEYSWRLMMEEKAVFKKVLPLPAGTPEVELSETVSVPHWIGEPQRISAAATGFTAIDAGGKAIAPADLAKALAQAKPVLVYAPAPNWQEPSAPPTALDPVYLKLLRPGTIVLTAAWDAMAAEAAKSPHFGPLPEQAWARVEGELVVITRWLVQRRELMIDKKQMVAGKEVHFPKEIPYSVQHPEYQAVSLEQLTALTASGKAIPPSELTKRLAADTPVLVAHNFHGAFDSQAEYLKQLKPDTVILVMNRAHRDSQPLDSNDLPSAPPAAPRRAPRPSPPRAPST